MNDERLNQLLTSSMFSNLIFSKAKTMKKVRFVIHSAHNTPKLAHFSKLGSLGMLMLE